MNRIVMSLVPGAIIASVVEFLYPNLSSVGFVYSFVGGMLLYLLLSHILSSLLGTRSLKPTDGESFTILQTKLH